MFFVRHIGLGFWCLSDKLIISSEERNFFYKGGRKLFQDIEINENCLENICENINIMYVKVTGIKNNIFEEKLE